jgi:hypothetical protein
MSKNDSHIRQARLAEKRAERETSDADRTAWLLIARGWRGMPETPKARQLPRAARKSRANRSPGIRGRKSDGGSFRGVSDVTSVTVKE